MIRFIRARIPAQEARRPEKEEYFNLTRTFQHGFPLQASCIAYDASLSLLAIGTKTGLIRIAGAPNVEWIGETTGRRPIAHLFFVPGQGRIIALCDDQSFHLYEINELQLDCIATKEDHRLKQIRACTMQTVVDTHRLLIGTECGNIYALDAVTFDMTDFIIYDDTVVQSVPDDRKTPGILASLSVLPSDQTRLLIGFSRGLIVLYDTVLHSVKHCYISEQQLQCVHWHAEGQKFMSAHSDGSHIVWSAVDSSTPMHSPSIPFGPFPCMAITKLIWKTTTVQEQELTIFCGGMPRSSYGDRFTVSASRGTGQQHVVYDFSSKVIDFLTIDASYDGDVNDPQAMIVLCEEELVAIDFTDDKWGCYRLPYWFPLHSSPITAATHVTNVDSIVYEAIVAAGDAQYAKRQLLSKNRWPIVGGTVDTNANTRMRYDIIATGHEDGSVKLWSAGTVSMRHLLTVQSARHFQGFQDHLESPAEDDDADEWPPFRKVGLYDPFSDDPRFSVQRVAMDSETGALIVGGTAGQAIVFELSEHCKEMDNVHCLNVPIVDEGVNFVWKGHKKLTLNSRVIYDCGYQPSLIVQTDPPAAVTAVAIEQELNMVAVGSAYGYAVCDYRRSIMMFAKCLLTAEELSNHNASTLEGAMTRFKSFKKSLRDSFRRRRRRGGAESPTKPNETESKKQPSTKKTTTNIGRKGTPASDDADDDVRPIERAIEARTEHNAQSGGSSDTPPLSLVRVLHFVTTFVASPTVKSPSLWVGTNGGRVLVHLLTPASTTTADITSTGQCLLAKEIHLRHAAPVLAIAISSSNNCIVGKQSPGPHHVIICSEEQIKSFSLPTLKPGKHKFKLTGTEGSRIRKVQFARLQNDNKWESFIILVTNQGEINAFSLQSFKRYLKVPMTKPTDVHGILSTVTTTRGELFYLRSRGCEWQRIALSARNTLTSTFRLQLPDGVRLPLAISSIRDHDQRPCSRNNIDDKILIESDGHCGNTTIASSQFPIGSTVDSIRDYTVENNVVKTENTADGAMTITTKTTITKTNGANGEVVIVEKKEVIAGERLNGNAGLPSITTASSNRQKPTDL